jgi:hypothetical protein
MTWMLISDGGDGFGAGIRVVLNNGQSEDFLNTGRVRFCGQEWFADKIGDKSNGELQIGFFDTSGNWQKSAFFPAGTYKFVRIITSE